MRVGRRSRRLWPTCPAICRAPRPAASKGGIGIAEDPSRFSIACRAVGPVSIPPGLPKSEVIAFASASLFFKTFQVHRAIDEEKQVLVYTVVSTKLINGSPFNSVSAVPTQLR